MAHIYMQFDFGADEEKAQQAWHKLENWKQAFRLGEKLAFKFEREEPEGETADKATDKATEKATDKPKSKGKTKSGKESATANGTVKLLLRLGFSGHEKITETRWLERIPSEEPFVSSSPQVTKSGQPEFEATAERFENLDRSPGAAGGGREHPG